MELVCLRMFHTGPKSHFQKYWFKKHWKYEWKCRWLTKPRVSIKFKATGRTRRVWWFDPSFEWRHVLSRVWVLNPPLWQPYLQMGMGSSGLVTYPGPSCVTFPYSAKWERKLSSTWFSWCFFTNKHAQGLTGISQSQESTVSCLTLMCLWQEKPVGTPLLRGCRMAGAERGAAAHLPWRELLSCCLGLGVHSAVGRSQGGAGAGHPAWQGHSHGDPVGYREETVFLTEYCVAFKLLGGKIKAELN